VLGRAAGQVVFEGDAYFLGHRCLPAAYVPAPYRGQWWEAPASGALGSSPRWVSFAKGGDYSPYYADIFLCVDWDYERGTFKDFYGRKSRPSAIPQNRDYFGRPGLTWSLRSQKGFSARPVPAGCIFGHKEGYSRLSPEVQANNG
jgi:hypothetical protein